MGHLKTLGTQMGYPIGVPIWVVIKINDQFLVKFIQRRFNSFTSLLFYMSLGQLPPRKIPPPPTPKLTLTQTLTLTRSKFFSGAIVWLPLNPKTNPKLHTKTVNFLRTSSYYFLFVCIF